SAAELTTLHQPFDGVIEIERSRSGDRIVRKIGVLHMKDTAPDASFRILEVTEAGMKVVREASKPAAPPPSRGGVLESQDERAQRLHLIMQIARERLKLNPSEPEALFALPSPPVSDARGARGARRDDVRELWHPLRPSPDPRGRARRPRPRRDPGDGPRGTRRPPAEGGRRAAEGDRQTGTEAGAEAPGKALDEEGDDERARPRTRSRPAHRHDERAQGPHERAPRTDERPDERPRADQRPHQRRRPDERADQRPRPNERSHEWSGPDERLDEWTGPHERADERPGAHERDYARLG